MSKVWVLTVSENSWDPHETEGPGKKEAAEVLQLQRTSQT